MTKEEAEAAIAWFDGKDVEGRTIDHGENLLTLARAGAAVMFPGEEDVERVARAMGEADAQCRDMAQEDIVDLARAAIAAMKPMKVDRA